MLTEELELNLSDKEKQLLSLKYDNVIFIDGYKIMFSKNETHFNRKIIDNYCDSYVLEEDVTIYKNNNKTFHNGVLSLRYNKDMNYSSVSLYISDENALICLKKDGFDFQCQEQVQQ